MKAAILGTGNIGTDLLMKLRKAEPGSRGGARRRDRRLDPRDILIELGKRGIVGGQEDMILDVAMQLKKEKEEAAGGGA